MTDIEIRPLQAADLGQVVEMAHALAAHHGDQATLDEATLREDALGAVPWVTVLVAQGKERLLGYAALLPLAQVQFGVRGMDMQNLFVQPHARGQGLGAALVARCEAHAKALGCRYLAVGTHPDNNAAQQVYAALGYERRAPAGPRFGKRL